MRYVAILVRACAVIYMLVTWREVKNTFWYGSRFNGPLLCVERVTLSLDSRVSDAVLKGTVPVDNIGHAPERQTRIAMILGQRPSVFP